MFDLGDDIITDSHKIPWLIWIQILVMFLLTLIILLSYFDFFALDSAHMESPSTCTQTTQVAGNHNVRREIDTSIVNRPRVVENNSEGDASSVKDVASASAAERFYHPCRYFDLAKQAFLKCLGLDSGHLNSAAKEHEHED